MDEILDIVDENDNVVGQEEKVKAQNNNLRRRVSHVLVFNEKGEMALQLRGKECRFLPEYWSTAVGGHVHAGENYEDAAIREMEEEIGIKSKSEVLGKDLFKGYGKYELFMVTFKAIHEGPFKLEEGKVDKMEFFSLEKIREMIKNGGKVHPELLFLLKKYYKIE